MLSSPRKNGLTSLCSEVRVFKVQDAPSGPHTRKSAEWPTPKKVSTLANPKRLLLEKRGLSLRGVAFMTVLAVLMGFGGSGEHLALFLLVPQNTRQRGNRGGFGGFGGYAHDGYPP